VHCSAVVYLILYNGGNVYFTGTYGRFSSGNYSRWSLW